MPLFNQSFFKVIGKNVLCGAALLGLCGGAAAQIAVKGETVYTMAGEPLANGVVLIGANGKIERVGAASAVQIPANYQTVSAKVVTPGLIDAHSVVGLNGYLNQPHDQMALDGSGVMQPELRAIDAYNPEEKLVEWLRSFGVTTIHTGHAPGKLISGQTMIAKTFGKTVDDVTIQPLAMVAVTFGESALESGGRSPGTRAKQISMLRAELLKAQEAVRKAQRPSNNQTGNSSNQTPNNSAGNNASNNPRPNGDNSPNVSNPNASFEQNQSNAGQNNNQNAPLPSTDLRGDIMQKVIRREVPLLITANRMQDIMSALRLGKEFNIRIVLDGAADAHQLLREIKEAGVSVILHPTMQRSGGETENLSMETAAKLKQAGIPFALQSGFEGYVPKTRVVLFEAAVSAANGLSIRDAMATVTIDAARLLGLESRIGSLENGKDGDVAMFDGDPFEYTTHCTGTVINGKLVSQTVR